MKAIWNSGVEVRHKAISNQINCYLPFECYKRNIFSKLVSLNSDFLLLKYKLQNFEVYKDTNHFTGLYQNIQC